MTTADDSGLTVIVWVSTVGARFCFSVPALSDDEGTDDQPG